jgi:hypothetical protein
MFSAKTFSTKTFSTKTFKFYGIEVAEEASRSGGHRRTLDWNGLDYNRLIQEDEEILLIFATMIKLL